MSCSHYKGPYISISQSLACLLMQSSIFSLFLVFASGAPLIKRAAPSDDSFYTAPSNLTAFRPGEVIDLRSSSSPATFGAQTGSQFQLKYATTNTQNSSSYTLSTVYTPQNPKFPQKLISVQVWEDSAGKNCAPSYSLSDGPFAPDELSILDAVIVIDWALSQGYYVTVPDHEGPNNEFIMGHTEGQAGLDGIRATISHLGLPKDVDTALYGYSGGSHATAWMANLHEFYAPEVNIVGSVTGGTVVDLKAMIETVRDTAFSGFMPPAVASSFDAYPDIGRQVRPFLSASGNHTLAAVTSKDFCLPENLLDHPFTDIFNEIGVEGDVLSFPPIADLFARESLFNNVSSLTVSVPKFPRMNYHASGDEIVPYWADQQYTEQQCALGANIQFNTFPLGEHVTTAIFGLPGAIEFLQQALNGETPQVKCGTNNPQNLNITSPNVDNMIGSRTANRIRELNGKDTSLGKISW